ncbi:MAG: A/G-specific adenine glycosylase [Rhizobacter sp.]|nr:A/G-specific adenine glycosylase [Bacteriovorax sp.]
MAHTLFSNLVTWSESQYSHLPWREKRTLYKTLVSEIMLQQTTVGTVLNHFERFLVEYPTIFDLAKASEEQVCISWKGLGYYRRARSLRNVAIQVVEEFEGKIPTNLNDLLKLKGIGPYTANAIVAIGADKKALAVDANLERVLARFYGVTVEKGPKLQKKLWQDFEHKKIMAEIDGMSARALNEAMMDLGRIICQARKASCTLCPLKSGCLAFKSGDPLQYPVEAEKKESLDLYIKVLRVVVTDKKKILVYQKGAKEWLSGQWELPTFILETNDEKLKQYPPIKIKQNFEKFPYVKTGITKYDIHNYILEMSLEEFEKLSKKINVEYEFKTNDIKLNMSTATQKVFKTLAKSSVTIKSGK